MFLLFFFLIVSWLVWLQWSFKYSVNKLLNKARISSEIQVKIHTVVSKGNWCSDKGWNFKSDSWNFFHGENTQKNKKGSFAWTVHYSWVHRIFFFLFDYLSLKGNLQAVEEHFDFSAVPLQILQSYLQVFQYLPQSSLLYKILWC